MPSQLLQRVPNPQNERPATTRRGDRSLQKERDTYLYIYIYIYIFIYIYIYLYIYRERDVYYFQHATRSDTMRIPNHFHLNYSTYELQMIV